MDPSRTPEANFRKETSYHDDSFSGGSRAIAELSSADSSLAELFWLTNKGVHASSSENASLLDALDNMRKTSLDCTSNCLFTTEKKGKGQLVQIALRIMHMLVCMYLLKVMGVGEVTR